MRRFLQVCALQVVFASTACTQLPPAPLLEPAPRASSARTITRVPLHLEADELEMFFQGAIRGKHGEWVKFGLGDSMTPLHGFAYDAALDRFVVPGFHAIDRTGTVTFGAEPPTRSPGASALTIDELHMAWFGSDSWHVRDHSHILAVWYGDDTIVLLCAPLGPTKPTAHVRAAAFRFSVKHLDARTLRLRSNSTLPLQDGWYDDRTGWDPRSTLAGFLRDGSVVVGLDTSRGRGGRWFLDKPARTQGALHATVRIDADGETTILHRGTFDSANATSRGGFVGMRRRFGQQILVGVDEDGERMFRRAFRGQWYQSLAAAHANGVCVFAGRRGDPMYSKTIACFNREAELLWQRRIPMAGEWVVDDAGWVYVSWWNRGARNPRAAAQISAIDPEGRTAWTLAAMGPGEMMLVGDDELCFFDTPATPNPGVRVVPDLVCLKPRHQQP